MILDNAVTLERAFQVRHFSRVNPNHDMDRLIHDIYKLIIKIQVALY